MRVDYKGYEIFVRQGYVVVGNDPMGEPVVGFTSDIRIPDLTQEDPDGRILYDFPFDRDESTFHALTQEEVEASAKSYIDAHGPAKGQVAEPPA